MSTPYAILSGRGGAEAGAEIFLGGAEFGCAKGGGCVSVGLMYTGGGAVAKTGAGGIQGGACFAVVWQPLRSRTEPTKTAT